VVAADPADGAEPPAAGFVPDSAPRRRRSHRL
jgi:hypothetical protein